MTVGIDLDSTLNTLDEDWLRLYNEKYSDDLKPSDILTWDTHKYTRPECGMKIYELLDTPGLFASLDVRPGAKEFTDWLSSIKAEIYVVTAYHAEVCVDKRDWVKKNLPAVNPRNIIFCNNKGLIQTDILIDDGPHNILSYDKANPAGLPIVYAQPWNQDLYGLYPRLSSYEDIKNYIIHYFMLDI